MLEILLLPSISKLSNLLISLIFTGSKWMIGGDLSDLITDLNKYLLIQSTLFPESLIISMRKSTIKKWEMFQE